MDESRISNRLLVVKSVHDLHCTENVALDFLDDCSFLVHVGMEQSVFLLCFFRLRPFSELLCVEELIKVIIFQVNLTRWPVVEYAVVCDLVLNGRRKIEGRPVGHEDEEDRGAEMTPNVE